MIDWVRLTTTILAVFAAALGTASPARSAAPTASEPPTASRQAITTAQATAYALAVNLRARDVPGLRVTWGESNITSSESTTNNSPTGFYHCAGSVGAASRVAVINSPTFRGSDERSGVISTVRVMPTEALASADIAASQSPRGPACFVHVAELPLKETRVSRLAIPSPLPHRSVGLQAKLESPHGSLYLDYFSFVAGQAEVGLLAFNIGSHPFPRDTERHLLALLYSRAVAEKL